jgi:hypothetical protein
MLPLTYAIALFRLAFVSAPALMPRAGQPHAVDTMPQTIASDTTPVVGGLGDSLQVLVGPIEPATDRALVRGIAELFPDGPGRATLVLRLARGVPGAEHAFQLYRGRCGDDQLLIPVEAPAIAKLDANGRGKGIEEVILDLPDEGPFHVVIRAGTAAIGPTAGCANLSSS